MFVCVLDGGRNKKPRPARRRAARLEFVFGDAWPLRVRTGSRGYGVLFVLNSVAAQPRVLELNRGYRKTRLDDADTVMASKFRFDIF